MKRSRSKVNEPFSLIIRADDFGMCHAVNEAVRLAFERGLITCASLMAPCPWFEEAARLCREHPAWDVGLHLTLFSEWRDYRWGPVLPASEVPSLVDRDGFFHSWPTRLAARRPRPREAEKEFRAQLLLARRRGVKVSYLDFHIQCLPALKGAAQKVAREFRLPVSGWNGERRIAPLFLPALARGPVRARLGRALSLLRPGLNLHALHPGLPTEELRAIGKPGQPAGAEAAERDLAFRSLDPRALAFLRRSFGARLVGYRGLPLPRG